MQNRLSELNGNGQHKQPILALHPERIVIGSLLRRNEFIGEVAEKLSVTDFRDTTFAAVYAAILDVYSEGMEASPYVVGERLVAVVAGKKTLKHYPYAMLPFDEAPLGLLGELCLDDAHTFQVGYYASRVRAAGIKRQLHGVCLDAIQCAKTKGYPAEDLLQTVQDKVLDIASQGIASNVVSAGAATKASLDRYERVTAGQEQGLPYGFIDLDIRTAGMHPGELVIVAARTSIGKTCFAMNIIRNLSITKGHSILIFSLEQHYAELTDRLLCMEAQIDMQKFRKGVLSREEISRLSDASNRVGSGKFEIDSTASQTMLRIQTTARRYKRSHGIQLIVVDYLQLIAPENRRIPRHEQVAEATKKLKALAGDLQIPVMALAQVNRGPEDRADSRPRLSDLRESGSIEMDADTVLFLHRQKKEDDFGTDGVLPVDVIVAKQRQGPTGVVPMMFNKQYQRFENAAKWQP